jgi:type I restriction enzyme S subunit
MGQSPDSQDVNHDEKGVPFLQGCAEFGRQTPVAEAYCSPPLRTSQPDSILISVRAPVGTLNWAEQKYCIGRGLAAIKASPALADTEFLFYVLQSDPSFLHRRSQGSTFLAISSHDLHSFPVPDFPRPTQQKIARILQTVDQAIEKTEQLIEKYQQIKAGLMHDLFTRGIGADGQLRPPREQAPELYQQTPIGWIPKEWCFQPLENLLASVPNNLRSGPFGSALLKSELVEDGIPFLGIDNIHIEHFEDTFKRYVSESKFSELSKYAVRPKDVIITIMGTVGRTAVVPDNIDRALSSKHLWTMTFDRGLVIPELVCWQLNFSAWAKAWFRRETQGGIMDAIQSKTLRTLILPVPSVDEQKQIFQRYLKISNKILVEEQQLEKLLKQKSGLMHDLLTGTVPVSVDPGSEVNA